MGNTSSCFETEATKANRRYRINRLEVLSGNCSKILRERAPKLANWGDHAARLREAGEGACTRHAQSVDEVLAKLDLYAAPVVSRARARLAVLEKQAEEEADALDATAKCLDSAAALAVNSLASSQNTKVDQQSLFSVVLLCRRGELSARYSAVACITPSERVGFLSAIPRLGRVCNTDISLVATKFSGSGLAYYSAGPVPILRGGPNIVNMTLVDQVGGNVTHITPDDITVTFTPADAVSAWEVYPDRSTGMNGSMTLSYAVRLGTTASITIAIHVAGEPIPTGPWSVPVYRDPSPEPRCASNCQDCYSGPGVPVGFTLASDMVAHHGTDVCAESIPGAQWLSSPTLPSPLPSRHDVATIMMVHAISDVAHFKFQDPHDDATLMMDESGTEVIPAATRDVLIDKVDAAWREFVGTGDLPPCVCEGNGIAHGLRLSSREDDFKLVLRPRELMELIGVCAYDAIARALGGPPDALAVRRTVGMGRWIGFHADWHGRTVQVPLSDDGACVGGKLVFAFGNGDLVPAVRRAGCLLAHDGDVIHGVTRLVCGTRYSLFGLVGRSGGSCDEGSHSLSTSPESVSQSD